ncbi:MAG: YIP1 family protein, partial [Candidatus Aenigmarchaeota archaeon]|nr:YIP1 family protein [Candidatus Aenigmarchaeota archaeon]
RLHVNMSNEFQNMNFIEKAKMIIFDPKGFFNIMPQKGGYKEPIIFYTIFIIIPILLYVLYLTIVDFFSVETFIFLSITVSIGLLILILINLFLSPLFFNILFKRLGGKGTYESTFRVIAYSSVPYIIIWLPLVGLPAAFYQFYIEYGSSKSSRYKRSKNCSCDVFNSKFDVYYFGGIIYCISHILFRYGVASLINGFIRNYFVLNLLQCCIHISYQINQTNPSSCAF